MSNAGNKDRDDALVPILRAMRVMVVGLALAVSANCAYVGALNTLAGAAARGATPSRSGGKLMIFGGQGHRTYLGCLSCSEYQTESVFNQYGTFGSAYGTQSIFNAYSAYGSPYSTYSACNAYASDPPVIVDEEGRYYGRLTVRTSGDGPPTAELRAWLAGVCQH